MKMLLWEDRNGFTHTMRCGNGDNCLAEHLADLDLLGLKHWVVSL